MLNSTGGRPVPRHGTIVVETTDGTLTLSKGGAELVIDAGRW